MSENQLLIFIEMDFQQSAPLLVSPKVAGNSEGREDPVDHSSFIASGIGVHANLA